MTLWDYLLGPASKTQWQAMMILACAMAAVMMFQRVKSRDKMSINTPVKFSWGWFIGDNIARILSTIISIFLFSRVSLVWVDAKYTVIFAVFVGLISDQLPVIFSWVKEQGVDRIKRQVVKIFGKDKEGNSVSAEIKTEITEKKDT